MKNLLIETWVAISGVISSISDLFVTLFAWMWSVLLILHTEMPRLEGLLVGILLAWFFVHRDKNPVMRALAAPLKIVLDILDIIWDETIEAALDLFGSVKEKMISVIVWAKETAKGLLAKANGFLISLKDRLLKRNDQEEKAE